MMVDLIRSEDLCKEKIRESEKEVEEILDDRTTEESASRLEISVYDTMRNEKVRCQKLIFSATVQRSRSDVFRHLAVLLDVRVAV